MMRKLVVALVAALALFSSACPEAKINYVPLAEQPKEAEPVVVPYPPPPAKVDVIVEAPSTMANPAWLDGQWKWRGRRWLWEPGRWVDLAPGQVYAPPFVVRRSDGELLWYVGVLRYTGAIPPEALESASASASASAAPPPSASVPAPSASVPTTEPTAPAPSTSVPAPSSAPATPSAPAPASTN